MPTAEHVRQQAGPPGSALTFGMSLKKEEAGAQRDEPSSRDRHGVRGYGDHACATIARPSGLRSSRDRALSSRPSNARMGAELPALNPGTVTNMPQAVRFDHYGPVDVLEVVEVEKPTPDSGQVLVEVVSTSINPGEIAIREGEKHEVAPASFPSGQGSDLAGRVVEVGAQVGEWGVGDEVIGWTDERAAQAEFVAVPADQLVARPSTVPWDQACSLYVAGGTACGMLDKVPTASGETAVVFAAAGGVGSFLTQLLVRKGVRVLAVVGPANDEWVRTVGAEPVHHGEGLAQRLRDAATEGIDAAYDAFGDGYLELAIAIGIDVDRIITIIDFEAAERLGAKIVFGYQVTSAAVLSELVELIEAGDLVVPVAASFPLTQVREAYTQLAERHTRGKIVLSVSAG